MQILRNSRKLLSLLCSSVSPLRGDELWLPPPELEDFLPSAGPTFDGVEGFGFPYGRVDCTAFFLGEDILAARSFKKNETMLRRIISNISQAEICSHSCPPLTLYSLTLICIFSILFSTHFLRCWLRRICIQSQASLILVGDHFLYSHNLSVKLSDATVRRITVTFRD